MKPRIFINMHYLELGGAESALIGMLQSLDTEKVDVDVFIHDHRGELMPYVPTTVNLLPEVGAYSMLERPIAELMKKGYWSVALMRMMGRWESQRYAKHNTKGLDDATGFTYQQRRTVKVLPKINPDVEYDLAISFITPHYIVLNKVRAKKKLGWIHTDYTNIFINPEVELEMWSRLDYIASISEEVGNKFCEVFPSLRPKLMPIENILSSAFIRQRAEEFVPDDMPADDGIIKLLTIGRFCHQKKMEDIPYICRRLNESGLRVKWFIIGYGADSERKKIEDAIAKEGVASDVIILGKRSNPYPYIKMCDIYVQPSRYEGKSITVREAQILCKPVIVTHYPTAPSQINSGVDGVIVPLELDASVDGMVQFIKDKQQQQHIVDYLRHHDYGNESEINKIYKLIS